MTVRRDWRIAGCVKALWKQGSVGGVQGEAASVVRLVYLPGRCGRENLTERSLCTQRRERVLYLASATTYGMADCCDDGKGGFPPSLRYQF